MTHVWDPSVSIDVVAYVIYFCLSVSQGSCSPWEVETVTQTLSAPHVTGNPPLGGVYVYDVEARDGAGNESTR